LASKVEGQEHWAFGPQLSTPKVGDRNLNVFGFQLLVSTIGDLELGALGPQLLVLKVETHDSFGIHILLEKKILSLGATEKYE